MQTALSSDLHSSLPSHSFPPSYSRRQSSATFFDGRVGPVVSGQAKAPAHILAAANAGLVLHILSRRFLFLTDPTAKAEAYTMGYLGLVRAAERYDPGKGYTFASYACDFIHGYILHHLKSV